MNDIESTEVVGVLEVSTVIVADSPNGETRENEIISPLSDATKMRSPGLPNTIRHNLIPTSSRSLDYSSPSKVTASLPENVSEALFLDGYDSDGLLPNIPDMQEDLSALEDYSNIPIGREVDNHEDVGTNGEVGAHNVGAGNGDGDAVEVDFVFVEDSAIIKLKADEL